MNKPLVSIIVPVYNAEKYLERCMNSLITQSYTNLEIIAVDDGSTDESAKILNDYVKRDSRICIVHQDNQGAAMARKNGLTRATGEYVMFVDCDDWIDSDTVQSCMQVVEKKAVDCVMFSYVKEYEDKSIENPLFEREFYCNAKEADEKIHRRLIGLTGKELRHPEHIDNLSSFCMKLYRAEVARKGRFISERIVGTSEDMLFNLYALEECSVCYINRCFYHYRKTNEQSITTHYKADLPAKWDVLYQMIGEYVENSGEDNYRNAFLNRVACGTIGLGLNEIHGEGNVIDRTKAIHAILERPLYKEAFQKLDISKCPIKWKLFFSLCRFRCSFLLVILLSLMDWLRSRMTG